MQFQKMPKPAGWQEEQAVEIRRDWISYLAKGMGIDAKGVTGVELEALVVRRMLEQAVRAQCACSFLLFAAELGWGGMGWDGSVRGSELFLCWRAG